MRSISYKYNVGDVVELKPKHYFETEVMGIKALVTAVEVVERRDYNGPCYALGGCKGFWKESCFVGLASTASVGSSCREEAEGADTLQGLETKCNTEGFKEA